MEFLRPKDLVAITFFLSILGAIKLIVDARMRGKLIATASEEFYRSILQGEEAARRHASLRWGIILTSLAAGCALIALLGWNEVSPRTAAILLCATGLGNLAAYAAASRRPEGQ
jgi:CHASE2 domain-containing sensor protein